MILSELIFIIKLWFEQKVPYRAIYPNATPDEWILPKRNVERTLNVVQLRDPNAQADHFWDKFVDATNELGDDEESEGMQRNIEFEGNDRPLITLPCLIRFFG